MSKDAQEQTLEALIEGLEREIYNHSNSATQDWVDVSLDPHIASAILSALKDAQGLRAENEKTSKEALALAKVRRMNGSKSSQVSRRKKRKAEAASQKTCKHCEEIETDKERTAFIELIAGRPRSHCDLCGSVVAGRNLSGWDEDGHVYCTKHGPLATRAYCDEHAPDQAGGNKP